MEGDPFPAAHRAPVDRETYRRARAFKPIVVAGGARGLELVEVMDLDGDGTADPFYESSGWEGNDYVIYRLVDGRLEEAFRGSGYGC